MNPSRVTFSAAFSYFLLFLTSIAPAADSPIALRSERESSQTDRVLIHLEVNGDTLFTEDGKQQKAKLQVDCNLDYFEKTTDVPTGDDTSTDRNTTWRSIRDYQKASAVVRVGDGVMDPMLQPIHHLVVAEAAAQTVSLFSPTTNLTRNELDAIDIQGSSLLVDRLLPEKPVTVGDHWEHSEKLMAAMLGLEEVAKTTVKSTLKEVTPVVARFEFSGHVEGAIYGIATIIDVKGKYRFNLKTKRIDWLGMVMKENRPDCFIADGVDACSRLQMTMTPTKEPESLSKAALSKMTLKSTPDRLALQYESPDASWQCHCDRRWYVHHQRPKASEAVLRFLDRGMLAGQCNLSSLAAREPGKSISLDEFQADVHHVLGESFGEFVEAGQFANATNCRVYRVVVQGVYHTKLDKSESEIPMRWIYYLVTNAQGRQVAMTFAVEQSTLERFANADKLMIGSLQFAEKKADKQNTSKNNESETKTAKSGENRG